MDLWSMVPKSLRTYARSKSHNYGTRPVFRKLVRGCNRILGGNPTWRGNLILALTFRSLRPFAQEQYHSLALALGPETSSVKLVFFAHPTLTSQSLNISMETKREPGVNEPSTAENNNVHLLYMRKALDEARKCTHVPTAFCVGCIIVIPADETEVLRAESENNTTSGRTSFSIRSKGLVLATGYSRELPGNTHAEANALHKARQLVSLPPTLSIPPLSSGTDAEDNALPLTEQGISDLLAQSSIYTTLEPCSVRTSGLAPCANAILDARIKKCYIGAPEPPDFVTCEGAKILRDAGVEVVWVKGLEEECLSVARGEF